LEPDEITSGICRRKATLLEIISSDIWADERLQRGLPPWVDKGSQCDDTVNSITLHENAPLRSSRTLRNWADEYCRSKKYLKEFTYHKFVYGWDIDALKSAIRATIISTSYTGDIHISFKHAAHKISVRPDNIISHIHDILSNPILRFIPFVYPFVLLFEYFFGAQWQVCGGAYRLKGSVPAEERDPDSKAALRDQQAGNSPMGGSTTRTIGLKEGQWLRQWERSIKHAVASRRQSFIPLIEPQIHDLPNNIVQSLDGYTDTL